MTRQADDLPAHAFQTMQAALNLCSEIFPGVRREDMKRTFVDSYFNQADQIIQGDRNELRR